MAERKANSLASSIINEESCLEEVLDAMGWDVVVYRHRCSSRVRVEVLWEV